MMHYTMRYPINPVMEQQLKGYPVNVMPVSPLHPNLCLKRDSPESSRTGLAVIIPGHGFRSLISTSVPA